MIGGFFIKQAEIEKKQNFEFEGDSLLSRMVACLIVMCLDCQDHE